MESAAWTESLGVTRTTELNGCCSVAGEQRPQVDTCRYCSRWKWNWTVCCGGCVWATVRLENAVTRLRYRGRQDGGPQDGGGVRRAQRAAGRPHGGQADGSLPERQEEPRRGRGGGHVPHRHGRSGVRHFPPSRRWINCAWGSSWSPSEQRKRVKRTKLYLKLKIFTERRFTFQDLIRFRWRRTSLIFLNPNQDGGRIWRHWSFVKNSPLNIFYYSTIIRFFFSQQKKSI